jgi:hypothetical protein
MVRTRARETFIVARFPRTMIAAICGIATVGGSAFASAAPYNPERLPSAPLNQVGGICRTVMGLSPSESESTVWGAEVNPGLTPGENHYEGCIAALSASARAESEARALNKADEDCRSQGLKTDSPALAECVLRADDPSRARLAPGSAQPAADPVNNVRMAGSFFRASRREVLRREEEACAALGLDPAGPAFDGCMKTLIDTFYSIDNPQH